MKVDATVHPSLFSLNGFHAPALKTRTRKGGGVAVQGLRHADENGGLGRGPGGSEERIFFRG